MIAFASCLLAVGCGGGAPPPESAPPPVVAPPAPGATAVGDTDVPKGPAAVAPPVVPTAGDKPAPPPDPKKGVGQAVVDAPEALSGKLTQDDIRRILEKSGDVFGECYTLGAGGKMKDFKGTVTVKATLGPLGIVNQVDVLKSTAKNPKVDACVRDAFKKIKFPRPKDGATSVITFPITFAGVEQVQ